MGRKGVSKRKPNKTKTSPVSNMGTNSVSATLAHASDSPAPLAAGKGEPSSIGKGGKKKSSDSSQNNKRR